MIQDIAPHRYDNAYRPAPPAPDSFILWYEGQKALIQTAGADPSGINGLQENTFTFPRFRDLEPANEGLYDHCTYLFSIDGQSFYLPELPALTLPAPASRFSMEPVAWFRSAQPRHLAFAGITGHQLFLWYQGHRFCGRCQTALVKDEAERMMRCPACGQMEYPKISPAVIIAVTDQSRLLLSKYAGRTYKRYALLAGFNEIGETLEETVRREVMEEVGLAVTNIRYYKSQPWSFSGTLLAGFFCDLAEPGTIRLDDHELALAQWFEREDIPLEDEEHASLTHEMIRYFYEHEEAFSI